jgi:hypothetical protein
MASEFANFLKYLPFFNLAQIRASRLRSKRRWVSDSVESRWKKGNIWHGRVKMKEMKHMTRQNQGERKETWHSRVKVKERKHKRRQSQGEEKETDDTAESRWTERNIGIAELRWRKGNTWHGESQREEWKTWLSRIMANRRKYLTLQNKREGKEIVDTV